MKYKFFRSKRFILSTTFIGILAAVSALNAYSSILFPVEKLPLILAPLAMEGSAPTYVADNMQYFSKNGLAVTIKDYDTGVAAMKAVLSGEVDIGGMTEFVVVGSALQKQKVSIIGVQEKGISMSLVARKNHDISNINDLKGKRIGLTRGTIAEYFLGRFLDLNGMNIKDVILVDLPPTKWMDAFSSGNFDAIVGWSPYITQIQERYGQDMIEWSIQSNQLLYGIAVGNNEWVAKHSDTVARYTKAIAQAEEFIISHPALAKEIVRNRMNVDIAYLDKVWPKYNFSLSLDQTLILSMEDEARWMMENDLTKTKEMPNFLNYIYPDALEQVKPEVVIYIH